MRSFVCDHDEALTTRSAETHGVWEKAMMGKARLDTAKIHREAQ